MSVLPRHLDPRKFAQQRVSISGQISVSMLERLQPLLATSTEGGISANLEFGIDEQGIRNVTGVINARLAMVCQRCLEASFQDLELPINLGIVWSDEQAANLSKSWDPWILDEGQTDIYQMIEDELILGLPIVAYHDTECVPHSLYQTDKALDENGEADSEKAAAQATDKPNPFQVLEELKGSLSQTPDNIDPDMTKH